MARYILLLNWTDQGVKNAKDTVKRASDAKAWRMPLTPASGSDARSVLP